MKNILRNFRQYFIQDGRGVKGHRSGRRGRKSQRIEGLEQRTLLAAFVVDSAVDIVDADSLTTLREAIMAANAAGIGPHTITFGDGSGSGGTNFTDGAADTILLSLGQMTISESLTITGLSAVNTIIDGNNASRIFSITSGDTTLEQLTLTGGRTTAEGEKGGAIYWESDGELTVSQCMLFGNSTAGLGARGGAIFVGYGVLNLQNSTLIQNSTTGQDSGGAWMIAQDCVEVVRKECVRESQSFCEGRGRPYGKEATPIAIFLMCMA